MAHSERARSQDHYREMQEREPVRFFLREFEELYFNALAALAEFIRADAHNIAFVPNVTSAVNAVLRSLPFKPGDELLTTNHAYPSCKHVLHYVAHTTGAQVVFAECDFPVTNPDSIIEAILSKVTTKTRIALIDHITSPTGLIFPIAQIVKELSRKGIDVLVDGAHAPGSIPLNVESIGAAYYTANCHKWICSPKGSAFLYVRPDKQETIFPATISHPYIKHPHNPHSRFESLFYWTGTNDFSAFLCVPDAIRFMNTLFPGGWKAILESNHALALQGRQIICNALHIDLPCPDSMIAAICSFPLPDGSDTGPLPHNYIDPLQNTLYREYHIEVPVFSWPQAPRRIIRTSSQLYNSLEQYERLAEGLKRLGD
jgi:isopenicillin-N epimerase